MIKLYVDNKLIDSKANNIFTTYTEKRLQANKIAEHYEMNTRTPDRS